MTLFRRSSSMIDCSGEVTEADVIDAEVDGVVVSRASCRCCRRREYVSVSVLLLLLAALCCRSSMASMVPTTSALCSVEEGFQSG